MTKSLNKIFNKFPTQHAMGQSNFQSSLHTPLKTRKKNAKVAAKEMERVKFEFPKTTMNPHSPAISKALSGLKIHSMEKINGTKIRVKKPGFREPISDKIAKNKSLINHDKKI